MAQPRRLNHLRLPPGVAAGRAPFTGSGLWQSPDAGRRSGRSTGAAGRRVTRSSRHSLATAGIDLCFAPNSAIHAVIAPHYLRQDFAPLGAVFAASFPFGSVDFGWNPAFDGDVPMPGVAPIRHLARRLARTRDREIATPIKLNPPRFRSIVARAQ